MHSISNRANAVFAYFVTSAFSVLALVSLTSVFQIYQINPIVSVSPNDIIVNKGRFGTLYDYKAPEAELGNVHFDLDA
ncbi:hypothetical protein HDU92_007251, partial [Lobulomyces angularis]